MSSWGAVVGSWGAALKGGWLPQHVLHSWPLPRGDDACEEICAKLLGFLSEGAPAGVHPSRPWQEFLSSWQDLKPPDHAAQRMRFNLERFAGNYVNIVFFGAVALCLLSHPLLVTAICGVQGIAVLGPPQLFDVDVRRTAKQGGGYAEVGGGWLRLLLAVLGHGCLWLLAALSRSAHAGAAFASLLVLLHAYLRTRPLMVVAKEKMAEAKEKLGVSSLRAKST